ncbi:MAG: hypothetical protein LW804_02055 [Cryomorphaceae bacterium]|jgi:hypothetical protein|nr:hypothetical protein [Cryomorphaceae bacterium]
MKYKFDISSKPNRLAFALGISIIVGVICGKITERKVCKIANFVRVVEIKCDGHIGPREIITYNFNTTNAIVSGALTFGVLLVLNGFVRNQE